MSVPRSPSDTATPSARYEASPERVFALCCRLLAAGDERANDYLPLLDRFPDYAPGWTRLGHTLWQAEQPAAAEVAFDNALRGRPISSAAVQGKALVLLSRDRAKDALGLIENRMPSWRSDAGLAQIMGRALYALKRLDPARAALGAATDADPMHAEAWFRRGLIEQDEQAWTAAATAYERALSARPSLFEAALNLGICRQQTGDLDAAMAAYASAFSSEPACFNRVAQALTSSSVGRLWLDPAALRVALLALT